MRNAFAQEITELAGRDERVVMLMADIGNRLFDTFKAKYPTRFYNCGVAEANMIGMAAGLASAGFRPYCYTITPFATTRCLEQIRVDLCYHEMPVVVTGTGSGLSYASLGVTHHSCEDIAMLRCLPHMKVLAPADSFEVRACLRATLSEKGPVYMRIGKKGEPTVHTDVPALAIGKALVLRPGEKVALLNTGNMLPTVLEVAAALKEKGIAAEVATFPTVKPLDEAYLRDVFARFPLVATIEEHSLIGGFGAAVAEWACDQDLRGSRLLRFGTSDVYLHKGGEQEYAREEYGLSPHAITDKVLRAWEARGAGATGR